MGVYFYGWASKISMKESLQLALSDIRYGGAAKM